ncbi:MAG: PAS domain-containing protein [Nitrospirae bacterium]|nr:MAG: PAS domain-containing protein [Nitrospirota bacterium]
MVQYAWVEEFSGSIVVCDHEGIIIEMNDRAETVFKKWGGKQLIGSNLLDCHPEPSRSKLMRLMEERKPNIYTIEKNGVKKLVYQTPWHVKGEYRGFVEIVIELPDSMPHFIRDASS